MISTIATPLSKSSNYISDNKINKCLVDSIQCGDSSFLLNQFPENSVDFIITSPPYFKQRSYNGASKSIGIEYSIDYYIDSLMDTFYQAIRVIKPTGSIVYNIGDKYINNSLSLIPFKFAIKANEISSIQLVNNITWVKSNPIPRQFNRRLINSTEPFFHFVKTNDYYYERDQFYQVDKKNNHSKPTSKLGSKYRILLGKSNLNDDEKSKANKALDDVIYEVHCGKIQGFRMKIRDIHAKAFGGEQGGRNSQIKNQGFTIIRIYGNSIKRDVIQCPVESIPGIKHTAIFPEKIIREFIKMLCPLNGLVLDPYIGSGTSAVAALKENRHFVGIDIDPEYCQMAKLRIKKIQEENDT
ncbi:MAG: site-specific DNA-methyltransferase [Flavobacteriaceae bacterium]|nr:site-specific DNA-methyltransferase [Flavobacteriaceae bacterium]